MYPLLMKDMLAHLAKGKIFKLDLWQAYYQLRIKQGDKCHHHGWKLILLDIGR